MDNIFERDRNGEVISSNEPGYELLIDDFFLYGDCSWAYYRKYPRSETRTWTDGRDAWEATPGKYHGVACINPNPLILCKQISTLLTEIKPTSHNEASNNNANKHNLYF